MGLANGEKNKLKTRTQNNKYFEESALDKNMINNDKVWLFKQIKPNTNILDAGCAQGEIGGLVKECPGCKIYGVEINEDAIAFVKSKGAYADIFQFNLEHPDADSEEYKRFLSTAPQFDYIIFSNVLEHMVDPTAVLYNFGNYLKIGGKVLISVPNIAHADISLNLLNGVFNYSDVGILDNTHVRFFTKQSFAQWIDDSNQYAEKFHYDCEYLGGTFYLSEFLQNIKEHEKSLCRIIEASPDCDVLQHCFALTKQPCGDETSALKELLAEPTIKTTILLDDALKGKFHSADDSEQKGLYNLCRGERETFEQEIISLKNRINGFESEKASVVTENNALKFENAALTQNIQSQAKEIDKLRNQVLRIISSRSWNITSPLRKASSIFHHADKD